MKETRHTEGYGKVRNQMPDVSWAGGWDARL